MNIKKLFVMLVSLAALVLCLSACGAKVSTKMTVDSDFAGERVISVSLDSSDLEEVTGGAEALDKIAKDNLPEELAYTGEETEDGGYLQTFTLKFSDKNDYVDKVTKLLAITADPESEEEPEIPRVIFENYNTVFKDGLYMDESFTSLELLDWYESAIEDADIISSSRSNWCENTGGELIVDGKSYTTTSAHMDFDRQKTNTLDSCNISTKLNDDGTIDRSITFSASGTTQKKLKEEKNTDIETYFSTLKPENCEMQIRDEEYKSTYVFSFTSDAAGIVETTNHILQNDNNVFDLTVVPTENEVGMATVTIKETVDASYYTGRYQSTVSAIELYPNTTLKHTDDTESGGTSIVNFSSNELRYYATHGIENTFSFDWKISFETTELQMLPGSNGSAKLKLIFTLPESMDEAVKRSAMDGIKTRTEVDGSELEYSASESSCTVSVSGSLEKITENLNLFAGTSDAFEIEQSKLVTASRFTRGFACDITYDFEDVIGDSIITADNEKGALASFYYSGNYKTNDGIPSSGNVSVYSETLNIVYICLLALCVIAFVAGIIGMLVSLKCAIAEIKAAREAAKAAAATTMPVAPTTSEAQAIPEASSVTEASEAAAGATSTPEAATPDAPANEAAPVEAKSTVESAPEPETSATTAAPTANDYEEDEIL